MNEAVELIGQIAAVCGVIVCGAGCYAVAQLRRCHRVLNELRYSRPKS